MTEERKRNRAAGALFWVLALAGLGLARVPWLTSPVYLLDNDEAVLGLMARRMAEGQEWPFFFVGQNYGLALFETWPAALAFSVFGSSATVLTATILTLYLLSLPVWSSVLETLGASRWWGRALVVLMAMTPGWIVWSTKARGLYVSGFVLTGVVLALLTRRPVGRPGLVAAALLSGCIALIQPLWLVLVLPFWFDWAAPEAGGGEDRWRWGTLVVAGGVVVLVWGIPTWLVWRRPAFWQPDFLEPGLVGLGAAHIALQRAFAGVVTPNVATTVSTFVGWMGVSVYFLVMIVLAAQSLRTRSRTMAFVAGAMVLAVAHALLLRFQVPRYYLPATVLPFVGFALLVGRRAIPYRGVATAATVVGVGLLAAVALTLGQPPSQSVLATVDARDDLNLLIRGLHADGVAGVYAASSDVQWQILFYGESSIPVRGASEFDRYPEFVRSVDEARASGARTALVADVRRLRDDFPELGGFPGYRVGERYLRLDDPSDVVLALLDFEFEPLEQGVGASVIR